FFQAEDGIRDRNVTGVQTCALPISDLDSVLSDDNVQIYFDAQITHAREAAVRSAIAAGKHIYVEKPTAETFDAALELAKLAQDRSEERRVGEEGRGRW